MKRPRDWPDPPDPPESELLTGIQKVEFAVGTKWYDSAADCLCEVVAQTPYSIYMVTLPNIELFAYGTADLGRFVSPPGIWVLKEWSN